MAATPNLPDLRSRLKFFAVMAMSAFIDTALLVAWLALQWLTNACIEWFQPSGSDMISVVAFQFIFAVSTMVPVALYTYQDIVIMAQQIGRSMNNPRLEQSAEGKNAEQ